MEKNIYDNYLAILREEMVPAMGCTEPIALAYGAARAREVLGKDDFEVTNKYGFVIIEGNLCLTKINIREKGLSKPELFISKNKLKLMKSDRKGKTLDEVSSIEIDDIIIVNQ